MGRLLAGVGLQVWIFGFIAFFGSEVVLLEPQLRVVAQLLYAVPLVVWAAVRVRRPPDLLDLAVIGALALYLVVALFSRDRTGSLETFALVGLYALLFWVLRDAAGLPSLRSRIAIGIGTAMAFSLALNAFLLIREKLAFFTATGRLPQLEGLEVFPWETVNVLPVLVLLAVPFVVWMPSGRYRTIVAAVIALSAIVVIPFSNGRAGYLGLAVAVVALVLLTPRVRDWFWRRSPSVRRATWVGLAIVAVVALWRGWGPFVHAITSSGRGDLYEASAQMFAARPIFGHGPSTYSWARFLYGTEPARVLAVRLTHDVPLQTLVDGGLVLAAGLLGVVGAWLRSAVSWSMPLPRRVSVAALIGFAAAVLFDDFSFLPSVTAMVICLAAFALPQRAAPILFGPRPRAAATLVRPIVIGLLALAVALPFAVQADRARFAAASARNAAMAGHWAAAAAEFEQATAAHPENGGYWIGLAKARAELGQRDAAGTAYKQAAAVSPGEARAYGGLAALTDDLQERIALLERAADLTAGDPQFAYRLGIALAEAGDERAAAVAWGRAVDLRSAAFGVLPFSEYRISKREVATAAVAHSLAATRPDPDVDPDARWDVALALQTLPADAEPAWHAVDLARSGDLADAQKLASMAVDERPYIARSYQAQAAVAAFDCDEAARERALAMEAATRDAYGPPGPPVEIHREFVYREASIGGAQPSSAPSMPAAERWPWSVIGERPRCR